MSTVRSVQHRCTRMAEHMRVFGRADKLPVPCPECFSVIVTSERVEYVPSEAWSEVAE